MNQDRNNIKTSIQIQRLPGEVYEAIVNPVRMAGYFIAKGSGRLDQPNPVQWSWPEFDGNFEIHPGKCIPLQFVSFYWDGAENLRTYVEMQLEAVGQDTKVTVRETADDRSEPDINWLKNNMEGWANFLACLKANLEYGINLRRGAFEFMRKNT